MTIQKTLLFLVDGSWITIKEQMSGLYEEELAKQGYITLAFDPHYFGESEGQPRFLENPTAKIADFKNAITYLQIVPVRGLFALTVKTGLSNFYLANYLQYRRM